MKATSNAKVVGVAAMAGLALGLAVLAQAPRTSDEAAVRTVAQLYIDGMRMTDTEKLERALHPDMRMTGLKPSGEFLLIPREEFLATVRKWKEDPQNGPIWSQHAVEAVDVRGAAAVARVSVETQRGRFTDFLSMLKLDGEWRIVHKVWHMDPKEPPAKPVGHLEHPRRDRARADTVEPGA